MANRIVHFEIEAKDPKRAKEFYSKAFGWGMQEGGEEYGGYITVITGDPKEPGGINGGIFKPDGEKELNAYSCVVAVDDINKAVEDVKAAGGKVLDDKPVNIPGVGIYAKCEDTERNRFSLLQPDMSSMQQK